MHVGQDGARDIEQRQQFVVPPVAMDVEEHGARGVADIGGMHLPPVSCHSSQVSMVPKASSPLSAGL
jgi:hypothetical protein